MLPNIMQNYVTQSRSRVIIVTLDEQNESQKVGNQSCNALFMAGQISCRSWKKGKKGSFIAFFTVQKF